jgi:Lecithin:cholesterol acyltransferase
LFQDNGLLKMIPVLPAKEPIRSAPKTVQIYQFDASPIGQRQPLLLVHGLDDERAYLFCWKPVCEYLSKSEDFQKRFKIYLTRYDTHASQQTTTNNFKSAICNLASTENNHVVVVALSIGGNIVRNAMADPEVDRDISRVITLGTPFHGSPLFCKDWMQYSVLRSHSWPFTSFDRYAAYTFYFRHHRNLQSDYYWDNCDQQFPDTGPYVFRFPAIRGVLSPPAKAPVGVNTTQSNDKFIAYASYMKNQVSNETPHTFRYRLQNSVSTFFGTTMPAHFSDDHAALRILNFEIASAVQKGNSKQPVYALNDGIVPIISALSIPTKSVGAGMVSDDIDIGYLRSRINIKKARLFANIDHVTFLDGRTPRGCPTNLPDLLSPGETPRPIFSWLLNDILN